MIIFYRPTRASLNEKIFENTQVLGHSGTCALGHSSTWALEAINLRDSLHTSNCKQKDITSRRYCKQKKKKYCQQKDIGNDRPKIPEDRLSSSLHLEGWNRHIIQGHSIEISENKMHAKVSKSHLCSPERFHAVSIELNSEL